jgi:molybdate transport system permease protein
METDVIVTTLRLGFFATVLPLVPALPLAWWLSGKKTWYRNIVSTICSLPIVLPPSVLGFYLLIVLSPQGSIGRIGEAIGVPPLTFSFTGLVIAVSIASFPFILSPLQTACEQIGSAQLEAAAMLGAGPVDRFISVILPRLRYAIATGCVAGFAHALGAFGVVLMVGGSIPGQTRVMATALYEYVETSRYSDAHLLAAIMVGGSFVLLFAMNGLAYGRNRGR